MALKIPQTLYAACLLTLTGLAHAQPGQAPAPLWTQTVTIKMTRTPEKAVDAAIKAVTPESLIIAGRSGSGGLTALDTQTGETLWQRESQRRTGGRQGGRAYRYEWHPDNASVRCFRESLPHTFHGRVYRRRDCGEYPGRQGATAANSDAQRRFGSGNGHYFSNSGPSYARLASALAAFRYGDNRDAVSPASGRLHSRRPGTAADAKGPRPGRRSRYIHRNRVHPAFRRHGNPLFAGVPYPPQPQTAAFTVQTKADQTSEISLDATLKQWLPDDSKWNGHTFGNYLRGVYNNKGLSVSLDNPVLFQGALLAVLTTRSIRGSGSVIKSQQLVRVVTTPAPGLQMLRLLDVDSGYPYAMPPHVPRLIVWGKRFS